MHCYREMRHHLEYTLVRHVRSGHSLHGGYKGAYVFQRQQTETKNQNIHDFINTQYIDNQQRTALIFSSILQSALSSFSQPAEKKPSHSITILSLPCLRADLLFRVMCRVSFLKNILFCMLEKKFRFDFI